MQSKMKQNKCSQENGRPNLFRQGWTSIPIAHFVQSKIKSTVINMIKCLK